MPAKSIINNNSGSQQTSSLLSEAGGLEFKTNLYNDVNFGSVLTDDHSYVLLQGKCKELIQLNNGNVTLKAQTDLYLGSQQHMFKSVGGDYQSVLGGNNHSYVKGNETKQVGEAGPKEVDAAKKLQEETKKIDEKKVETIKNTEGTDVPCPVCSSKVLTDRGQCLLDLAVKLIRLAIPNFPYPLDILEKFLNFLAIPFLSPEEVKELNAGKGCGSPGCKGGMVKSPQKAIQKANEEAVKELEKKQKELEKHQRNMGSGGTHAMGPFMSDVSIMIGHPETMNTAPTVVLKDHNVTAFGFTNNTTPKGAGFIPKTKGNCKKAIHTPPLINPGSLFLGVTEKFTMTTGSPGIDIHTTGLAQLNATTTTINATEGELTLASNNVTTIKGKNIVIDANDRSGDTGVRIDSENTMVGGALHVQGDLALKGTLSMDGGLFCTHITCPGERISTGPSGAAHQVHSGATWNNPVNGLQATIYDKYDKKYKAASRDIFNALSSNLINGMAEIKTLIEETYASIMIGVTVDNSGLPTGYAQTYFTPPGVPSGTPLMVNGIATAGPYPVIFSYTFVVPGQTLPVFNFTHNHGSPGGNHSHDYTSFQGHAVANSQTARASRPEPSHVPTPAKSSGMGSKPGHKNVGDLCLPCINPFGGSSKRNAKYGLGESDDNVYNGTNFVQTNGVFDEVGNLIPPPTIDLNC